MALRDQLLGLGSSVFNTLAPGSTLSGLGSLASGISGLAGGNPLSAMSALSGANTLGAFGDTFSGLGSSLGSSIGSALGIGSLGNFILPGLGLLSGLIPGGPFGIGEALSNEFNIKENMRQIGMAKTARERISNQLRADPNATVPAPDLETAWLGYDQSQNPWQNLGTNTVDVPGLGTADIGGISDYLSAPVEQWGAGQHGTRMINDLASELGAKAIESGIAPQQQLGTLKEPGGLFSILNPGTDTKDTTGTGRYLNVANMGGNYPDIMQHLGWRQTAREWFPEHAEWLSTHMTNPGHPGAEDYWNYDRDIGYDTGD